MYVGVSRNLWSEEQHMWMCDICLFVHVYVSVKETERERDKCVRECEKVVCLHVHILIRIFKSPGWDPSPCVAVNGYKWCNTSGCINNWAHSCKPAGQMASIPLFDARVIKITSHFQIISPKLCPPHSPFSSNHCTAVRVHVFDQCVIYSIDEQQTCNSKCGYSLVFSSISGRAKADSVIENVVLLKWKMHGWIAYNKINMHLEYRLTQNRKADFMAQLYK